MQAKPLEQEARRVDWKDLMLNRMGALLGLIIIMIGLSLASHGFHRWQPHERGPAVSHQRPRCLGYAAGHPHGRN